MTTTFAPNQSARCGFHEKSEHAAMRDDAAWNIVIWLVRSSEVAANDDDDDDSYYMP